jgi:hypothetical protein
MRMRAKIVLAILPAVGAILLLPGIASANAQRRVGPYRLEIGFGTEPTYVGQPNSVELLLTKHGRPVLYLGDTLKVDLTFGNASTELPLVPNFARNGDGIPGDYRAWFVPTKAGAYTFTFTGRVHGTSFDVSVTGGPSTFDAVQDPSSITFPKIDFPPNDELATRIRQDAKRTRDVVAGVSKGALEALDAASAAKSAASTARSIGLVGVLVGAAGVVVGAMGLSAARKKMVAT